MLRPRAHNGDEGAELKRNAVVCSEGQCPQSHSTMRMEGGGEASEESKYMTSIFPVTYRLDRKCTVAREGKGYPEIQKIGNTKRR